jgi:hypothetical protein
MFQGCISKIKKSEIVEIVKLSAMSLHSPPAHNNTE